MTSPNFARPWAPASRDIAPNSSTRPSTAEKRPIWYRSPRFRLRLREDLAARHSLGLPEIARRYESSDGTRRYLLRLDDGRTVETVLMPEGERDTICISSQVGCPVDCKFCMTALLGLERSLTAGEIVGQVLLVARDNGPAAGRRPAEHRDDGPGRAAAQPGERGEGHRHSARPGRLRTFPAPHHGFDRGHRSQDRGTGARAGAAEAGDLAQRLHRGIAAGADAHHAQVPPEGPDGGVPRLSAAAVGEADVRIRAAEGRERYRRRRAARGEAAGQLELQGEPDRAESRTGDSVSKRRTRSAWPRSRTSCGARCRASFASRAGWTFTPLAGS